MWHRYEYEDSDGGAIGLFMGIYYVLKIYGAIAVLVAAAWALWKVIA